MNFEKLHIKCFLFVCLLASEQTNYAQDTTFKFSLDTSVFTVVSTIRFQRGIDYLEHSPDLDDEERYKKNKSLIGQIPTQNNHELYFDLACSLWELNKLSMAEKMFLTIIHSKEQFYSNTYYHSSDIPGDTVKSLYGYGSFTSNYKNYAAIYLAKIYLEQKKYSRALQFLEDAGTKYEVKYTCGTGFNRQKEEYDFLYAYCFKGLGKYKEVVDLLLPSCLNRNSELVITSIKKLYSKDQIQKYLSKAEGSIKYSLDSFLSVSYRATEGDGDTEQKDTITFYSGTATISLFDRQVNMPVPHSEKGEQLSKDQLIRFFKESDFYIRLNRGT